MYALRNYLSSRGSYYLYVSHAIYSSNSRHFIISNLGDARSNAVLDHCSQIHCLLCFPPQEFIIADLGSVCLNDYALHSLWADLLFMCLSQPYSCS